MHRPIIRQVLCIVQLPPPMHGVSSMNIQVIKTLEKMPSIVPTTIDMKFGKSISELERFTFRKVWIAAKYAWQILTTMNKLKPQLVYFTLTPTGFAFYRDAIYVFLIRLFRTKVLLHLHGKGISKNIGKGWKLKLYKMVFSNTNVICLSERLSEDIKDVYPGRPFIVNNGIAESKATRNEDRYSADHIPTILYLSNYIRNKGVIVLVEAMRLLKNKGLQFKARLVGSPSNVTIPMLHEILQRYDLHNQVEVVGPLYGDSKLAEFQNADIFAFPTYNDAFPLVTLEAMQHSLPIVSTFEGSVPDIVKDGHTGLLVAQENFEMLAEKLELLLTRPALRQSLGENGFKRYSEHYTLEKFSTNIRRTFEEVLDIEVTTTQQLPVSA